MTRAVIRLSLQHKIGHPVRDDGPKGHAIKAGTPTMGGLAIVGGAFAGYGLSDLLGEATGLFESTITRTGLLVLAVIAGAAGVGLMDDWIKVTNERNLGLNARLKSVGLLVVSAGFAILVVRLTSVPTKLSFVREGNPGLELGTVGWAIWALILIYSTSNAVNLTDGADGLAAGSAMLTFGSYAIIAFWIFRQSGESPALYNVPHALDLAVIAAAMLSACAGFLWFAAAPADIFMGDTGSLALGTGLAAMALVTNTHLLLAVLGGLYVVEASSVILQVGFFKLTRGRRLFRMAPIHHHFELSGWKETKLIVRFWLVGAGFSILGLMLFYADWIAVAG